MATKAKKTTTKKTNGTSKTQAALKLLRRPKGATREEVLKILGWGSRKHAATDSQQRRQTQDR
jgi:hypothetical protein